MSSQTAKPTKSKLKLGLILGLILGIGGGVGGSWPFINHFQKKLESETAAKAEVQQQLESSQQTVEEKKERISELGDKVIDWQQKHDTATNQSQQMAREIEQLEEEIADAERRSAELDKQVADREKQVKDLTVDRNALQQSKDELEQEVRSLDNDLRQSKAMVSTLRAENERAAGIPRSQRAPGKDGVMTVQNMKDEVQLPIDGPINTLRIVDMPSKKQEDRFCYESSRNGQRLTLYFNEVPFGTIEHKVLKGKDTLVLNWKDDSPLFWIGQGQRNRNVSFEKEVAHQLSQNDIAFLYESKRPNKEKLIEFRFLSN